MTKDEYKTYLETEHWQDFTRKIRWERDGCERCHITNNESLKLYGQRLNIHHKTYKNLGHEERADVELLCWACHLTHHGMGGWVAFVMNHAMEAEVPKIPLICANCTKPTGQYVYNFDEITEVLCWECRA